MDLLDFNAEDLYFDQPLEPEVDGLLAAAAEDYGVGNSELPLLRAYFIQPQSLTVLVALYRYFYYQHRLTEAMYVAERVLEVVGTQLDLSLDWRDLSVADLGGTGQSITLVRFFLFALKGAGYLELRLGRPADAMARFDKILAIDTADRLGVAELRELAQSALAKADSGAEQRAA